MEVFKWIVIVHELNLLTRNFGEELRENSARYFEVAHICFLKRGEGGDHVSTLERIRNKIYNTGFSRV